MTHPGPAFQAIDLLILCGCSRCGKRLVYDDHRLPCVVDAPFGNPTAVHCAACADVLDAALCGQEAALNGLSPAEFRFETQAEYEEFMAEYRRTLATLAVTGGTISAGRDELDRRDEQPRPWWRRWLDWLDQRKGL